MYDRLVNTLIKSKNIILRKYLNEHLMRKGVKPEKI